MKDLQKIFIEIQDSLIPTLDTYEQAIYHYIFRHTYLIGEESTLFSTKRASIGLGSGVAGTPPSESQKSKKLRSLESKGAIKILERSHRGILVKTEIFYQPFWNEKIFAAFTQGKKYQRTIAIWIM